MKIIIDAMGGDNAPLEIVKGALAAREELGVEILLVGRGEDILRALQELNRAELPEGVEIKNATEVVEMEDDPATATRVKSDSSMTVGLKMLRDGAADAFISAGSTGALLSGATLIVKRAKGVRRASLGVQMPSSGRGFLLIDSGANAECTPEYLMQFAAMGHHYAREVSGISAPRVGLLNIGAEETKGTDLQKTTYAMLQEADRAGLFRFVGNVEARGAFLDDCDVLVADGFSGNVLLKGAEGLGKMAMGDLKGMFLKSPLTKLAALLVKKDLTAFKKKFDASEVGGTMLLGIKRPVIKAHGSAKAKDILSATRQAIRAVESDVCGKIEAAIAAQKATQGGEEA